MYLSRTSYVVVASCLIGICSEVIAPRCAAYILDWDGTRYDWTERWSATSNFVSQTFTDVNSSGVDITIRIERGPATDHSEIVRSTYPDDLTSPISRSQGQGLQVAADFSDRSNDYLRFTISFSKPVKDVDFDLWDIDFNGASLTPYQDVVQNFSASLGTPIPEAVPTFQLLGTGVPAVKVVNGTALHGIATSGTVDGSGSNDNSTSGDVKVRYGQQTLTSISFDYQSGDGSSAGSLFTTTNTGNQNLALGDFNFTPSPIPEVSTSSGALFACGVMVFRTYFGRRRRRLT